MGSEPAAATGVATDPVGRAAAAGTGAGDGAGAGAGEGAGARAGTGSGAADVASARPRRRVICDRTARTKAANALAPIDTKINARLSLKMPISSVSAATSTNTIVTKSS